MKFKDCKKWFMNPCKNRRIHEYRERIINTFNFDEQMFITMWSEEEELDLGLAINLGICILFDIEGHIGVQF